MQSPALHPCFHNHRLSAGAAESGRRLSSARSFDTSSLEYVDSRGIHQHSGHAVLPRSAVNHGSFTPSPAVQPAYHVQGYMENSSFSSSNMSGSQLRNDDWETPKPLTLMTPGTPGAHVTYAGASATSRSTPHTRNGHYDHQSGFSTYDHSRAPISPVFHHSPTPSENYGGSYAGTPAPSFSADCSSYVGSHSASYAYAALPVYRDAPRPRETTARCEWADCRLTIDDTSPAGIARHLRQYHNVQVTDNRSRHACKWGAPSCGKDMYPSSFGKHIAECHLRNMVKQCPHCGADFARADTLTRHIKAFCPNSNT